MSDRSRAPKPFRLPPAKHRVQEEIDREFRFHIDERIESLIASGMTREEAQAEMRRKFGDYQHYSDETRDIDVTMVRSRARRELAHDLLRNARLAARTLARTPGFTALAIVTLALGIGATVAIHSVLDSVVLRPLPFPRPEELVAVKHPANVPGIGAGSWALSGAGYHYIRKESRTLADLGAFMTHDAILLSDGDAALVPAARISASLVNVLGLNTALGRLILPADDQRGAEEVAVLSYETWQARFGSDSSVLGWTVDFGGVSRRIIGVMQRGTMLPLLDPGTRGAGMHRVDVWLPLQLDSSAPAENSHYLLGIGRMKTGITPEAVQNELMGFVARFPELFPSAYSASFMTDYQFGVSATPLRRDVLGSTERVLWIVFAAVILVFAIAATNVANLFLVRAEMRRRDTSVRSALGAGHGQLAVQYATESLLLALLATVLGIFVATMGVKALVALGPERLPRLDEVSIGIRSVAIAVTLGIASGMIFGLFPLAGGARSLLALRDGGRGTTVSHGRRRIRRAMIVGQVTLALVLLAGAGLMVRSVMRLNAVRPGFDPRGVLAIDLPLSGARYRTYDDAVQFHRTLIERVSALPGVLGAGMGTRLPIDGMGGCAVVFVEGRADPNAEPPCVKNALVSPGYFAALRISVRGRVPTWGDLDGQTGAVVVSRTLADRLWPGEDPIGKGLRPNGPQPPYFRVVGVTAELRGTGLEQPPTEVVFYPVKPIPGTRLWQPANAASLVLRTSVADPSSLTAAIRRVVTELDPSVPLANVRTMESVVRASMARTTFIMVSLGIAAAMAVILSAVGLYAVISYIVTQRRSEIGVRMALGARVRQVSRLVMVESLQLAVAGVVLGVGISLMVNRMLSTMLFEVQPSDPLTLGGVSALLISVAVIASLVPAWRASRVDPIEVLREG